MEDFQQPECFPLWAIFQRRRQRTSRVKAFLDFLMERFASAPWRAGRGK
jgi:DNA-binding transcriptional LysR family regulator